MDDNTMGTKKTRSWLAETTKILVFVIIVSIGIDYWRSKEITTQTPPNMVQQTTTGEWVDIITLSQQQPVVVYFWATWCPVCKFVSPSVNWLSSSLTLVSVAATSGNDNTLNAYQHYHDYQFPIINDQTGHLTQQWGISVFPSIIILYQGEVKSTTTGFTTPLGIWIRSQLAYL